MKNIRYYLILLFCTGLSLNMGARGEGQSHRHDEMRMHGTQVVNEPVAMKMTESEMTAAESAAVTETAEPATKTEPAKPHFRKPQTRAERRALRKSMRKKMRKARKANRPHGVYADDVICLIVGLFIPPLGVFLMYDIGNYFWIDLILTILFYLPGWIFALIVILMGM